MKSKTVLKKKRQKQQQSKPELQNLQDELQIIELELKAVRERKAKTIREQLLASQRKKLYRDADESLPVFSGSILGYDDAEHQIEWEIVAQDDDYKKIALAAPRNHSKTTVFSVKFPLWLIKKNPNIRIVLVSNAQAQAMSFLREIVANIERNQNYIEWAGNLKPDKPDKWTDTEIIIRRDNLQLKDPTISAVGMLGTILSKRADVIICDDILTKENTRTPEQRKKVKEWFDEVLLPILEPNTGRIIVAGTLWDPQDLLTELLDDPEWDYREKFSAIINDAERQDLWDEYYQIWRQNRREGDDYYETNKELLLKGAKVLWEQRFPYRVLWHLRKNNSFAFARMYQSMHVSRLGQPFQDEWIERAKAMGASLRLVLNTQDWVDNFNVLQIRAVMQGVDIAGSDSEEADDTVILTLAKTKIGKYVILNIERGKYSPKEFRTAVKQQWARFTPAKIKVESNATQIYIKRDLAEDGDADMPIEGYNTGGEKYDELVGIYSLAALMENDKLILPYDKNDSRTIRLIDQLVSEMKRFPDGHTGDSLMALWFALLGHREVQVTQSQGYIAQTSGNIRQTINDDPAGGSDDW